MEEPGKTTSAWRDSSTVAPPSDPPPLRQPSSGGTFKKVLGPLAIIGILLAKFGKLALVFLKFIPAILKTGGSMFLMIWIYTMKWGWWYALGFVLLLFVHECGHLIAARRLGLKVGAPVFIPFVGAIIALKDAPKNAMVEAQVGIGGPILGSIGAAVCYLIYRLHGEMLFGALAYSGFMLNLFNLAPLGFLDGGRIVTVLSPWLWLVGAVIIGSLIGVQLYFYHQLNFLLCLIFILSLPRLLSLFRKKTPEELRYFEARPRDRIVMAVAYFGLAGALVFGMIHTRVHPDGRGLQGDNEVPVAEIQSGDPAER